MATAWARIHTAQGDPDDKGAIPQKVINIGDKVSKADVGDDWDYLVLTGVIRNEDYPVNVNVANPESPRDHIVRKAKEAMTAAQAGVGTGLGNIAVEPAGSAKAATTEQ